MHFIRSKNLIILSITLVAFVIPVTLLETNLLQHTNGNLVFSQNDTYLNASVAKNLAFYKVWGVSKLYFQPASSSLLYPLLLAAIFFVFGSHLVIPLILNILIGATFLYTVYRSLVHSRLNPTKQIIIMITALLPLPLMVVSGTVYPLQLLLCYKFMETLTNAIHAQTPSLPRSVYITAILSVTTSYDSIMIIILGCLILFAVHRPAQSLKLLGISLIVPILFGILCVTKNDSFLPKSLMEGATNGYSIFLLLPAAFISLLFISQFHRQPREKKSSDIRRLSFTLVVIFALPFIARNLVTFYNFTSDCICIYKQQYPLAGFIHRYYRKMPVGVPTLGAVAYFSDGGVLNYSERTYRTPELTDSLSRKKGVRVAVVSPPWFSPQQLPKWNKIASWKILATSFNPGTTLNFFTINQYDTNWLRNHLKEYQQLLPGDIKVRYY